MSSRSRRSHCPGAGGMVAEGVVRAGRFGGSAREGGGRALPPYSLPLVAACAQVSRHDPIPPQPLPFFVGVAEFPTQRASLGTLERGSRN